MEGGKIVARRSPTGDRSRLRPIDDDD